jgi:hypothetical protein
MSRLLLQRLDIPRMCGDGAAKAIQAAGERCVRRPYAFVSPLLSYEFRRRLSLRLIKKFVEMRSVHVGTVAADAEYQSMRV